MWKFVGTEDMNQTFVGNNESKLRYHEFEFVKRIQAVTNKYTTITPQIDDAIRTKRISNNQTIIARNNELDILPEMYNPQIRNLNYTPQKLLKNAYGKISKPTHKKSYSLGSNNNKPQV